MAQTVASVHHDGVSCDGCLVPNFTGNRYKCLRCYDFDLCHACYVAKRYNGAVHTGGDGNQQPHVETHPVLCILSQRDFEMLYADDPSKNYETCKVAVFTCPYCGQMGFGHAAFFEHLQREHREPSSQIGNVNCPLCIACPEFDANREVDNLYLHWTNTHSNFDPGNTPFRDASRTAARRQMLPRRTTRQPAGNNANPRRTSQRTLQRLYAEVLAENNVAGGGGTATTQQLAQFGLPWTSDLVDVDDMFRMVNRTMPNIPAGFPAQGDNLRMSAAQFPTATIPTGSGMIRAAALLRAASASGHEYAQPLSATRAGSAPRSAQTTAVQVVRSLGTTPIYLPVYDDVTDEDNTLGNLDYDLSDFDGSSQLSDDGDEQEFESAEGSAGEERHGGDGPNADVDSTGLDEPPNIDAPPAPANSSRPRCGRRRLSDNEFVWDSEDGEESEADEDPLKTEFRSEPLEPVSTMSDASPLIDITTCPDPIQELRRTCTESEWNQIMRAAAEENDENYDLERVDTPRAVIAGSAHDEQRDPQCWLTIQLDTSQLAFANPTIYWKDTRFLRQKKMQRELSVASDQERTLEQHDVALALLRAGVPFPIAGRELDSTSDSIRKMMRRIDLSALNVTKTKSKKEEDEPLVAATRDLEAENVAIIDAPGTSSSTIADVDTLPIETVPLRGSDAVSSDEDEEDDSPETEPQLSIL